MIARISADNAQENPYRCLCLDNSNFTIINPFVYPIEITYILYNYHPDIAI